MTYLPGADAETFDVPSYLARIPTRTLDYLAQAALDEKIRAGQSEVRRELCRYDPLLFALIYLPRHLRDSDGRITMSDFHLDAYRQAREWTRPVPDELGPRDAYVSPRDSGKSTLFFLVLPLWGAAYGHLHFVGAFADTPGQAEGHLQTFKNELEHNELLRRDFPDLCTPARRRQGSTVADNQGMLHTKSGFVFAARGIGTGVLGLKVNERRPDLLVLDDIEPGEENYSPYLSEKRLKTLQDVILPLNTRARVCIVGTVTMPGSIVHQMVMAGRGDDHAPAWVGEEKIRVHHYQPIVKRADGSERSMWPAKWSIGYLQSIRHTRSYAKNFANDPLAIDGAYWTSDDFTYGDVRGETRACLTVDPATTAKRTSDETGLAVVAWSPSEGRVAVRHVEGVRLTGEALRQKVLDILAAHPEVRAVVVEGNQGGEAWHSVFHDMPVPVRLVTSSESKEYRAALTLAHYQSTPPRVVHTRRFPEAEGQMVGFPKMAHDDQLDAIMLGVLRYLNRTAKPKSGAKRLTYA